VSAPSTWTQGSPAEGAGHHSETLCETSNWDAEARLAKGRPGQPISMGHGGWTERPGDQRRHHAPMPGAPAV
jgi:hypothetical protein